MNHQTVTKRELKKAQRAYKEQEPRDVVYRAATALIDLAIRKEVKLSTGEALAILLQSWNKAYYRFRSFDNQHFTDLERILEKYQSELARFRQRSIESYCDVDVKAIKKVFGSFEMVLGPVGAAKCLHLLAPTFFPLWDRAIANAYRLALWRRGWNAERYCDFMTITKQQVYLTRLKLAHRRTVESRGSGGYPFDACGSSTDYPGSGRWPA